MKQITSILAISLFSVGSIFAQIHTDVQEVTTVKKVTMRDNEQITTQVMEETDADMEVISVKGNNEINQSATVVTTNLNKTEKTMDSNVDNAANKVIVAQKQAMLKKEMEASKLAEMEKAAKEKMILEQNKAKLQAELDARKKALESRPKGMSKLKKKNN